MILFVRFAECLLNSIYVKKENMYENKKGKMQLACCFKWGVREAEREI